MSLAKEIKMSKEFQAARHEALLNILRTANSIDKKAQKFFGRFGLTQAQYNVLVVLNLEGNNLTQVQIGDRLVVTRANITSILDKLEKKGYVRRQSNKSDRRIFQIKLTSAGRKIIEDIEPVYVEEVNRCMKGLTDNQCEQLTRSLEKVRDHGEDM